MNWLPWLRGLEAGFDSTGARLLGTAVTLLALFLLGLAVDRLGSPLKQRLDSDTAVESVQAGAMALAVAGTIGALLTVWGEASRVVETYDSLEVGTETVIRLAISGTILVTAILVTRVTSRTIKGVLTNGQHISEHQQEIAHYLVQMGVYAFAGLFVLTLWEIDVGNVLLGAGVLGIVLGLAARQTLGAALAGFVVLFSRPFRVGDWVRIDDNEGVVNEITVFNTRLRTADDEYVMVPNDVVTATEVVNRSRRGRLRLEVEVGVDYAGDLEAAVEAAEDAMQGAEEVRDAPSPHVVLDRFGDSAVVLRLRFWIDDPTASKAWRARTAVIGAVKTTFEERGIKIPYPQRELTGREETAGLRVTSEAFASDGDPGAGDSGNADERTRSSGADR